MKQILAAFLALGSTSAGAEEMVLTPAMAKAATALIQEQGYNCPVVKMVSGKGQDARGAVLKAWCGPDDGTDNVFSDFTFKLTARNDGNFEIAEWR
ncbi:MAG: hypothetical protein EOS70_27875 [Mesorhizobium sp.]|uniref:hypothetical protein n=1 Tax=Mesorhizobium sp. TaxID=1871066 RepID=UPI000FE5AEE7|nr:hypothetical protein [Mesorhizobium sp.]RWC28133.1 MAG: hypothetical protein EOS70_27875 [Mesorhizobium sp.]